MNEDEEQAGSHALSELRQAQLELMKERELEERAESIAKLESDKAISVTLTIFLAYVAKDWGIGWWGSAIVLVAGFLLTYRLDCAGDNMPGRKLFLVNTDAKDYAELRVLEQLWKRGSLKWKVYTDEKDKHKFIAPSEYHCGEIFLLTNCDIFLIQEARTIREFMRISLNARRKKIKELRKELDPVFLEARSHANETGAKLYSSLEKFESMK